MPAAVAQEEPVEPQSVNTLCLKSLKRTYDMFVGNYGLKMPEDLASQKLKIEAKIFSEYSEVKDLPPPVSGPGTALANPAEKGAVPLYVHPTQQLGIPDGTHKLEGRQVAANHPYPNAPGVQLTASTAVNTTLSESTVERALATLAPSKASIEGGKVSQGLAEYKQAAGLAERYKPVQNAAQSLIKKAKAVKPQWHPPWKLMRVISGHQGWVRSVSVDVTNQWFCTGSADRTIKIWDLATGTLKLTLTGHINAIRGLAVDPRHPYLFSCGEDKMVKCWDLEYNKQIRHYHGHLSGVYSISLHPTLDVLVTGGRDSVARVWDMRTKAQIHCLSGHNNTVCDVKAQGSDPQIVTASMDTTVRLWDLAAGKTMATLTNHKKSVRSIFLHPSEHTFVSASADNMKVWKFPEGEFVRNVSGHNDIINAVTINQDNVLVSGGDKGQLYFWDWKTGYNFASDQSIPQPGSLDSESGIFAMTFDQTGSRLISCEADKTIKVWREDDKATPETHPIQWKPSNDVKRW
mmetsp:Transcript_19168/g.32932  ORF Transcript_19168/g.32932 Transcript_19168/m.32932 type:complete len:518 (+) Transcript_19168:30-1583(+)